MSLGLSGETPYAFDPNTDFCLYDASGYATGRASGYYSVTSPSGEGISYAFDRGMVTVFAAQNANLGPSGSITIDYSFANLPGKAVFSVYGLDSGVGRIYHTNRAVLDNNALTDPLSTFEVVPEPASALLLCGGLGFLMRRRWRGRR